MDLEGCVYIFMHIYNHICNHKEKETVNWRGNKGEAREELGTAAIWGVFEGGKPRRQVI